MVTTAGVKTCKRNHPLTPDNVYVRKRKGKGYNATKEYVECKQCRVDWYESNKYREETVNPKREMPTIAVPVQDPTKLTECPKCTASFPVHLVIERDALDPHFCIQCGWRSTSRIVPIGDK